MNGHDTEGPTGMPNTQSFKQLWAEKEYAGGTQYMDELGFRSQGLDDMMDSDSESDREDLNEMSDNTSDDISIEDLESSKHVGSGWREGDDMYYRFSERPTFSLHSPSHIEFLSVLGMIPLCIYFLFFF